MKNFILSYSIIILFSCGEANKEIEKRSVVSAIKDKLGEPDSYEPIEWGPLQPEFLPNKYSKKAKEHKALLDSVDREHMKYVQDLSKSGSRKYDSLSTLLMKLALETSRIEYGYDSTNQIGYSIDHKYRAKNEHGAMQAYNRSFHLNMTKDTATFWK